MSGYFGGGNGASVSVGSTIVLGGANTQVMFNDSGVIGGDAGLTYVKGSTTLTTGGLTVATITPTITPLAQTAGTMTVVTSAKVQKAIHSFEWTNAMVVALGAPSAGDIAVCTLPAKTIVTNVYCVILTPDTSANALTVAVGRVGAGFIDYIVASDAKAAANTVYGDASAERGTNLTGFDLPNYTGTTVVNAHFIKTTTALNTVTGSTGRIIIETTLSP